MKISATFLHIILLVVILSACNFNANRMQHNKIVFESNRSKFEELSMLIRQLRVENKLQSNPFLTQEAVAELKSTLKELNIGSVELQTSKCAEADVIEIIFTIDGGWLSSWYTPGKFQVCYVPCTYQTNKGFEYYDGNHRNIYGLGDNWMMYSDTDLF